MLAVELWVINPRSVVEIQAMLGLGARLFTLIASGVLYDG